MPDTPRQVLESYKQRIIDAFVDSIEKNGKQASSSLMQSVSVNFQTFATKYVIEISMNDYWRWVDEGRKKGSKAPPLNAMLKHIAVRGTWHASKVKDIQNFYKNKKGVKVKRKKPLQADKARRQLAFLIGRSIKKKGIKPTYFVEEALEGTIFTDLQRDISEALGREIVLDFNLE